MVSFPTSAKVTRNQCSDGQRWEQEKKAEKSEKRLGVVNYCAQKVNGITKGGRALSGHHLNVPLEQPSRHVKKTTDDKDDACRKRSRHKLPSNCQPRDRLVRRSTHASRLPTLKPAMPGH